LTILGFIEKINQKLMRLAQERDFSEVFYLVFFTAGVGMYFISGVLNILLGLSPITWLLPFAGALLSLFTYYFLYKKGKPTPGILYLTLYNNFVFTPFMWLTNMGFDGGFHYFAFLFIVYSVILLKGKTRTVIVTLYILQLTVLMIFEAYNPEFIHQFSAMEEHYLDLIISFVFSSAAIAITVIVMSNLYRYERKKITRLSTHDPLTQQYNRRFITDTLNTMYHSAEKEELSDKYAIFIDIDNFKQVNDTKGHAAGDQLLIDVCGTIQNNIRKNDYLARIGGDEFLVIIHSDDFNGAKIFVNRLIKDIEIENKITISAGLTSFSDKMNSEDLLKKADDMMYRSKKAGKNRVSF